MKQGLGSANEMLRSAPDAMTRTVDIGKEISGQREGGDAAHINPKRRVLTEVGGRFCRDLDLAFCFRSTPPRACGREHDSKDVASVAMSKAAEAKRHVPLG
jgi:hypothetical protein